jgi:hypothetical protein
LGKVQVWGENHDIAQLGPTFCPGAVGTQDLTQYYADGHADRRYVIEYEVATCDDAFDRYSAAWIDFNGDSIFSDNERITDITFTASSEATRLVSVSFTIPSEADLIVGETRLRVMVAEIPDPLNELDPCARFAHGAVRDFTFHLLSAVPGPVYCDSGPFQTTSSNLGPVQLTGHSLSIIKFGTRRSHCILHGPAQCP